MRNKDTILLEQVYSTIQNAGRGMLVKLEAEDIGDGDQSEFGMDDDEWNEFLDHIGETGIATIEVHNGDHYTDNYYNVKFDDGYIAPAISGIYLEPV